MQVLDYFRIASKNLGKRPLRTFFTVIGIFLASVIIMYILSMNFVLKGMESTKTNKNDIQIKNIINVGLINNRGFNPNISKLNSNSIERLSHIKGVVASNPNIDALIPGVIFNNKFINNEFLVKGSDLAYSMQVSIYNKINRIIAGQALKNNESNEVILNQNNLKNLGLTKANEAIGKDITIFLNNINGIKVQPFIQKYKIVGVFSSYNKKTSDFIMSAKDASRIIGFTQRVPNFLNEFGYESDILQVRNTQDISRVQKEVQKLGFNINSENHTANEMIQNFSKYITLIILILAVIIIISILGIVNTLSMSVNERRKSIGIMRAVGASRVNIAIIFLIEAVYIGLLGTISATIFNIITFKNILGDNNIPANVIKNFKVAPIYVFIVVTIFMICICAIAGIYPAIKASKINPIESMRK